mmetsp:Transcript_15113/g.24674  ORF Transcript_15113/g.24674 Transcript_15113/m.24674 type:complete len:289 (-) Transcript_15113:781-1647(-)
MVFTFSKFALNSVSRVFKSVSSSFMGPVAPRNFDSIIAPTLASPVCAGFTRPSAELTSSSDICEPPSAPAEIMAAFSTSSSTSPSFSAISWTAFLASTRWANSRLKFLYGVNFFWASASFCCMAVKSASAFFLTSGAKFLATCSLELIDCRASVSLFCASVAAVSISSNMCFKESPASSGGSVMIGEAMIPTASTASSAASTVSCTIGRVSSNSCWCFSSNSLFCAWLAASFFACSSFFAAVETKPFSLVSSDETLDIAIRSFCTRFDSSTTFGCPAGPPFLASVISC